LVHDGNFCTLSRDPSLERELEVAEMMLIQKAAMAARAMMAVFMVTDTEHGLCGRHGRRRCLWRCTAFLVGIKNYVET
jgi:hypothetical protein